MSFLDNSGVEKLVSLIKNKVSDTFATKATTVTDVSVTSSNRLYTFNKTINGTTSEIISVTIPPSDVIQFDTSQSLTSTQQSRARSNIGVFRITAENVSVAANAWALQSSPTYADYPYRAAITVTGVTSSMFPEVIFSPEDATSGNYAPVATSATNTIYIYAKSEGAVAITVPSILAH